MTNLERRRRELRIPQATLARSAGITPTNLCFLEKGRNKNPTLKTAYRLARALETSVVRIFPMSEFTEEERA